MHWQAVSGLLAASLAAAAASSNVTSNSIPRHLAPATCSSQPGVDFVGKDLANVGGASGACCAKCQDTPGCKAYTWTDFNGGTCWLKSGVTQVQSYAGAISGTVEPRTEENTDYVGNDVGSAPGAKASDCVAKCKAAAGCGAYTWSDWNGGTCWLKSGRGEVRAAAGVHSAEVSDDDHSDAKWTIEEGKDYEGYDLTNKPGKEAAQCTTLCDATSGCRAFTWSDWNGGTCWLKSARGTAVSNKDAVSGTRDAHGSTTEQCELTQSADIVGNDIGSVPATDAGDCCALCSAKQGCAAYTWTQWNGGVCWLKSAVGDMKPSPGSVSGRVPAGGANTHVQYALRSGSIPSRSVNLGGWLVSEYWMSKTSAQWKGVPTREPGGDPFNPAVHTAWGGEYITMKYWNDRGERERGVRQFEEHRATWITEDDIREIRDVGLNLVRVPVGFWIVDDIPGVQATDISKVYAPGSLKYLDTLINNWAVKYNVAVMLSLHSHQGSQNGNDHSAPQEMWNVGWSKNNANYQSSMRFATKLAERYKDAPAFLGLGLMNEPTDIDYELAKKFYVEAYRQIRSTGNDCVLAVAPKLSNQDQWTNRDFMRWPEFTNVWTEWHVYYKWGYEGQNEYQIMDSVRNFPNSHFTDWPGNWVYMGEWSLGNPGEALFKDRNLLKQFAALQLESFKGAKAGWAFWSWHHDDEKLDGVISGWSLRQLLRLGIMTVPK